MILDLLDIFSLALASSLVILLSVYVTLSFASNLLLVVFCFSIIVLSLLELFQLACDLIIRFCNRFLIKRDSFLSACVTLINYFDSLKSEYLLFLTACDTLISSCALLIFVCACIMRD